MKQALQKTTLNRALLWAVLLLQLAVVMQIYVSQLGQFALHYKVYLQHCQEQGHTHKVQASCALLDLLEEKKAADMALDMLASLQQDLHWQMPVMQLNLNKLDIYAQTAYGGFAIVFIQNIPPEILSPPPQVGQGSVYIPAPLRQCHHSTAVADQAFSC
jgi:hypothetical protein